MVKKKTLVLSLFVFVLMLVLLNFVTIYFLGVPLSPVAITGKVVETGYVRLYVEGEPKVITIHSPENTTYDENSYGCSGGGYPKCDDYRYNLSVNVSVNFFLEVGDPWKYSLYDLKHGVYIEESKIFTPNTTIPFVRWGNLLTVFANEEDEDWVNNSVIFTIDVPNSAPIIQNFSEKIFVCESDKIDSLESSYFNVWDIDEEDFSDPDDSDINPKNDTFDIFPSSPINDSVSRLQIKSVVFGKVHLGDWIKNIEVTDSFGRSDNYDTNITVIEINNAPEIYVGGVKKPSGIGLQTIYMSGLNSVFNHQMNVSDVEDGWSEDGNLTFNLTGDPGFSFNSSTGKMSYVPVAGDAEKTYSITVCAIDDALSSVHENFSVCLGRGHTSDSLSVCDDFRLAITNDNRAPVIDSYYPSVTNFTIPGTTSNLFGVEVSDPDGAIPDISWYVNDILIESNENISYDLFRYTFGCGVSGNYNVTMITTDGIENVSQLWDIVVSNVDCPEEEDGGSGGGGGGGGGSSLGGACNERWTCHSWGLCQNVDRSFDAGSLSPEDFSSAKDLCAQNQYDDRFCGFQITKCFDLQMCNNSEIKIPKPIESRVCYFTENPNCIDGITNCHDGSCELLVDCGGPCGPCPSCSDGKRNQGEKGVDCGGPCPYACEVESAFGSISFILVGLLILIVLIFGYILYKLLNILRFRFFLAGKKRKKEKR